MAGVFDSIVGRARRLRIGKWLASTLFPRVLRVTWEPLRALLQDRHQWTAIEEKLKYSEEILEWGFWHLHDTLVKNKEFYEKAISKRAVQVNRELFMTNLEDTLEEFNNDELESLLFLIQRLPTFADKPIYLKSGADKTSLKVAINKALTELQPQGATNLGVAEVGLETLLSDLELDVPGGEYKAFNAAERKRLRQAGLRALEGRRTDAARRKNAQRQLNRQAAAAQQPGPARAAGGKKGARKASRVDGQREFLPRDAREDESDAEALRDADRLENEEDNDDDYIEEAAGQGVLAPTDLPELDSAPRNRRETAGIHSGFKFR